ncbi:F10-like kinase [Salmon gill poxvirus]|nr:F10-like kinase [Salmon gill poxvirus]
MEMFNLDKYLSDINKTSGYTDLEELLSIKPKGEQVEIKGDSIYYEQLISVLDLSHELPTDSEIINKFKSSWSLPYLVNIAQLQKNYKKSGSLIAPIFSSTTGFDELYFIQTGAFGMVFYYNNHVVKFVYQDKNTKMEKCPEYDIPNMLSRNLFDSGCSDLISKPKTMVTNVNISYLHRMYEIVALMILLIYKTWKKQTITGEDGKHVDQSITQKYKELLEWDLFHYLIGPVYFNLIKINIIFNKNLSSLFYFFQHKRTTDFSTGTIFIYDKAIGGLDNLTYLPQTQTIGLITKKQSQINLMESHPTMLRSCLLQLLILMYNVYVKYPLFLHYDMKLNNILLVNSNDFTLTIPGLPTHVFNFTKCKIKLHDFDFSMITGEYLNDKFPLESLHVDPNQCNWYYEMRKFVNNLLKNFTFITKSDNELRNHLWDYFKILPFSSALTVKNKKELEKTKSLEQLKSLILSDMYKEFLVSFD